MNILQPDDFIKTMEDISEISKEKQEIKDEIERLKKDLSNLDSREYLLNLKLKSPIIIFTDKSLGKYRFISHPLHFTDLKVSLYPLWIPIECTYPEWSNDFLSVNLVNYKDYKYGTGLECLVDALVKSLRCSYKFARELIINGKLNIPITLIFDCNIGSNILIDFNKGMKINKQEFNKHDYHMSITTDDNMMSNIAKIKYILVVPLSYSSQ
jgi:hypothetical protein